MFACDVLKRRVTKLVLFCISKLSMYIFFIPTHPYKRYNPTDLAKDQILDFPV